MTDHKLAEEIEQCVLKEDDGDGYYVIRNDEAPQIIAALRREPERQPSDRVSVPREPTEAMIKAAGCGRSYEVTLIRWYRAMLAAEAENDKP